MSYLIYYELHFVNIIYNILRSLISQKLVLHLLHLLLLWKIRKNDSFSCLEELPVPARNPEPPKNPSNLPQNRFKCLRRTFVPPRQKLALYDALKREVKIL